MVLDFLPVEEEGHIQPLLGQGDGGGHGNGDSLVGRTIQNSGLLAQLGGVGLGVELAQLGDLIAGLDVAGVDEVGNLPAGFGGEITEFQHACALEELNKLSFVAFHVESPFQNQSQNSATHRS